jgi:hypothetical protein
VTAPDDGESFHDGPDPHDWPQQAPRMWGLVLDVEYLDRVIAVLDGPVAEGFEALRDETRGFLGRSREDQRAELAAMILRAYRVPLPGGTEPPATEAVGGFRGDGDSPGNRDHM